MREVNVMKKRIIICYHSVHHCRVSVVLEIPVRKRYYELGAFAPH